MHSTVSVNLGLLLIQVKIMYSTVSINVRLIPVAIMHSTVSTRQGVFRHREKYIDLIVLRPNSWGNIREGVARRRGHIRQGLL